MLCPVRFLAAISVIGCLLPRPALASAPLDLGTPPTLEWGEHRLALQIGWPVQAVTFSWGTRSGWAGSAFATLETGAPDTTIALGMATTRPFAHRDRTSLFVHLAAAFDLQPHHPGQRTRIGGEAQGGLFLGVGLGKLRRVTWELGAVPSLRVGPGLGDLGPTLAVHGSAGLTFHLAPEAALSLRGRVGIAGIPGQLVALDWGAGAVASRLF
jgi:hypothetical protein